MPTPKQHENSAARQRAYTARKAAAIAEQLAAKGLPGAPVIASMPGTARWNALIDRGRADIEASRHAMQEYFDDRSENWQESERAEELQTKIEKLDEVLSMIDEI